MRGSRLVPVVFGMAGLLLVLSGAGLLAVVYDRAHRQELLPGVRIGHVDAGGLPTSAVVSAVDDRLPDVGARTVGIDAGSARADVGLRELGLRSDAREVVDRAWDDAERLGLPRRVWHRALNKPVRRAYEVRRRIDRAQVQRAVATLAQRVEVAPTDARLDTSTGFVSVTPAVDGQRLDTVALTRRVFDTASRLANDSGPADGRVVAPLVATKPKVTGFTDVLLVRLGENKLYHYENGVLLKTYNVATGTSRYPTPKGNFQIVLKRRNPTWVNPDPRGWGARLPARIGPGPRNPLGTRAMNLNAPGIRIHGTANVASLGRSASHGCIRMSIPDAEELFDLVDQDTPVAIIQGPPPAAPAPTVALTQLGDPNAPVDLEAG